MTSNDIPDLIHFADEHGNSVVLRVTELEAERLTGRIEVRSAFVNGEVTTTVDAADLDEWETVLDDLHEGDNTAWREDTRAPEIWLEVDDEDRLLVSVIDRQGSSSTAELLVAVPENWLDDHYDRLSAIRKLQAG
ncbi:DUF5959 family protein [Actinomadura decatromicini]|uniref:Uncharacterized protein n=1 Tax=Actinomadura decatromicini TaxID=2604572 RepID=A0A5D3FER9_9ACTN|nr:DUF5959 family protein [Actinomadura decatromicini]TYK46713.1 hypothetical protein FXF68_22950 [Actinomadura decatromicini]